MAEQTFIDQSEQKVKLRVFSSDYDSGRKLIKEVVQDNGQKQLVEVQETRNIILSDLRRGSHTPLVEDYIRTALANAEQAESHNRVRIEWWNNLPAMKKTQIALRYPKLHKKMETIAIQDDWVKLCETTAYMVSNMSVSSLEYGNKPIVRQYFEPHQSQELRQIDQTTKPQPKPQGQGILDG